MIVPDYITFGIDPRCDCEGKGGADHNFSVRCGVCSFCGERIKGMWFNEHEGECWHKQQEEKKACTQFSNQQV